MADKCTFVVSEGPKGKMHCKEVMHCVICDYCIKHCTSHYMLSWQYDQRPNTAWSKLEGASKSFMADKALRLLKAGSYSKL